MLALSLGGDATTRRHFRLKAWECDTGRELLSIPALDVPLADVAFDPSARRVALDLGRRSNDGADLKIIETDGGKELATIPLPGLRTTGRSFNADGTRIVALTEPAAGSTSKLPRGVVTWDTTGRELSRFASGPRWETLEGSSPDGRRYPDRAQGPGGIPARRRGIR